MSIYTILASLHHILAFILVATLFVELVLVRPGMSARDLRTLASTDAIYGGAFVALLIFGLLRVYYGESGRHYYFENTVFWLKMGVFALVAALSIWPTVTFFRWKSALKADPEFRPTNGAVQRIRGYILAEVTTLVLIPILAAMLARGYGG